MSCGSRLLIASLQRLQLSDNDSVTGGERNMVYAEKRQVGGSPYLKTDLVKKGLTKVKIIDEFVYVDTEFEGKPTGKKLEGHCSTQLEDPKEVTWTMNPTTSNWMIDTYGPNTEKWIGKEIEISVKQAGSANPGVYPKQCSLEKVIA